MTVREILRMGDARLLRVAQPVTAFDSDELHQLVRDLLETMAAVNGAGLAAPQIGVDLQLVVFGTDAPNPRYPDAPLVPRTVLCNPVVTPQGDDETSIRGEGRYRGAGGTSGSGGTVTTSPTTTNGPNSARAYSVRWLVRSSRSSRSPRPMLTSAASEASSLPSGAMSTSIAGRVGSVSPGRSNPR